MNRELVSVITASHNSADFIGEMIQSVLNQSYPTWELIITDDASTDDTVEIINSFKKKDSRIRLFRFKENKGPADARNNSIQHSNGIYIAFLDSDDLWLKEKLETQISFMRQHKAVLSYSSYHKISEEGSDLGIIVNALPQLSYRKMLESNYIGCLTAIYDARLLGKIFMPAIRKRQDWALWLKILKSGNIALGIRQPLAKYRVRNDSISTNKLNLLKYNWKVYFEVEKFSLFKSMYLMIRFLWFFFLKRTKKNNLSNSY